ncbi:MULTISPECIES: hypothetical protein [Stenotrophomonas]|jgi:hypothetical protein|uniref:Uncharacterized protein n=2 Tax=Stenotrophomonas TaxID=40323 RepID=A0AA40Y842_STEMA|nr:MULTISPECIES: hypothetical protein [Stenotrophomonas]MCV4211420.1 hypothetical protein [Pseudomonas cichorii]ELC7363478.1 hypothetical protein [Stenotrophomonas maltophilia]ELF4107243.1 hypothetical protein [Stenotrophomonas maltophilia]MBH1408539.1 hypothetical protein [Stenotrophomonas maltophilia]MBH1631308.1 hypothetical protein [Stenotrophomonas maltophilia]
MSFEAPRGAFFVQKTNRRSLRAGFWKAAMEEARMTPSAREVMLGITAALVPQFLLLVKVLSTQAVDKIMGRSTLSLWIGNRAFREPSRKST